VCGCKDTRHTTTYADKRTICGICHKPIKPLPPQEYVYPCCDTSHKKGEKCPIHAPQETEKEIEELRYGHPDDKEKVSYYGELVWNIMRCMEKLNELIRAFNSA
jgi:hypothetical protein